MNLKSLFPETDWKNTLGEEFQKDYWAKLESFLMEDAPYLPPEEDIFRCFRLTPLHSVKVVILGQDPYHGLGQAMGLSFSVNRETKLPPSLRNIYKELKSDLGVENTSGDLSSWAKQGVLLLNTVLTVKEGKAASHSKKGWELFTDEVIRKINEQRERVIFILWGNPAQSKEKLIDLNRHFILKAAHPSPLSAHRGFLGCRHFSKVNQLLLELGHSPIDWKV